MKVFIGYDEREREAYDVCEFSMRRHSSVPLEITPISSAHPLFTRRHHMRGSQPVDNIDGRPFSTDFAFARFLVPAAMEYQGWAMFVDCDFLFRADLAALFSLADERFAVMCVPHNFRPLSPIKMDGMEQQGYFRKCWSSLMLWNCGHERNRLATPNIVNNWPGSALHQFQWLEDEHIGFLPEEWNWLEGHSSLGIDPKAIHYTSGGPWFPYRQNVHYAEEWKAERKLMQRAKEAA